MALCGRMDEMDEHWNTSLEGVGKRVEDRQKRWVRPIHVHVIDPSGIGDSRKLCEGRGRRVEDRQKRWGVKQ